MPLETLRVFIAQLARPVICSSYQPKCFLAGVQAAPNA